VGRDEVDRPAIVAEAGADRQRRAGSEPGRMGLRRDLDTPEAAAEREVAPSVSAEPRRQLRRPAIGLFVVLRGENVTKTTTSPQRSMMSVVRCNFRRFHKGGNEMRMRHIAVIAALALAGVPAGALAAKPSHPTTPASTNADSHANGTGTNHGTTVKVTFVLHGTVNSYAAGSSISLTLTGANRDHSTLTSGLAFTATLNSSTDVVLHDGAAVAKGDMVVVKIRAAKNASTSTLSSTPASQVIDQGAAH
jgi:hypothetical protein